MEATIATPTTTTSTAATSAPATTPASGAPAAASSTPAVAERPRTFAEAFARDAATPESTASTPETAATGPDATTTEASAQAAKQGPIPFEAHKTALDNARVKAAQEANTAFERDYGWAKSIPRETVQEWSGIASLMATNPAGFLERYFAEAASHPQFGAQVKSWAARTLASRGQQGPAPVDLSPDVEITNEHGQVIGKTFSAERVQALLKQAVSQELQPLKAESEQRKADLAQQKAAQEHATAKQRIEATADGLMADAHDVLEISDTTPAERRGALMHEVAKLMAADPQLSIHRAAMQVRKTHVVPALKEQAKTDVLESLKTKAGAQTVNPSAPLTSSTKRVTSFHDKSLTW